MWARAVPNSQIGQIHFRSVPLRGPFCKGIQSRKMLYVRHKSEKTSCTLVGLQAAASLKLSLARFGSFILKLMRYAINLLDAAKQWSSHTWLCGCNSCLSNGSFGVGAGRLSQQGHSGRISSSMAGRRNPPGGAQTHAKASARPAENIMRKRDAA
jgi:hypothetical protein